MRHLYEYFQQFVRSEGRSSPANYIRANFTGFCVIDAIVRVTTTPDLIMYRAPSDPVDDAVTAGAQHQC
ncbi:hypothetical protein [Hyphomicrobium sulfonivorans]|uniref:hypothetical protein n=1 Tax=Hyphomicrobium sulfonivorans TaxID=121290 RepID=UPI00156DC040|nr:hypothetical protein [Hyphomicrobium sulfonivorans]MBI1650995.1 hypothetical protein [Hyphomicrobium sulfonivorans]